MRVFQSQPSPEVLGLKNRVEPVQPGVDAIHPVVVGRYPWQSCKMSHLGSTPTLELCFQLSAALPELQCSPALPDPISGLTSCTGLHNPVPVALHVCPRAVSDPVRLIGSDGAVIAPSTSAVPENQQIENLYSSVFPMYKTTFINVSSFSKTILQTCLNISDEITGPGFNFFSYLITKFISNF